MSDKKHSSVGKRALLGAILGKHIDAQVSLLSMQPAYAADGVEVDPIQQANAEPQVASTATAQAVAGRVPKQKAKKKTTHKENSATVESANSTSSVQHWWRRRAVLNKQSKIALLVLIALLVIAAPITTAYGYYQNRVMPGVSFAGQPVSGKSEAQVRQMVMKAAESISFKVVQGDQIHSPTGQELGARFDIDQTVNSIMVVRRSGAPHQRLAWWQKDDVPLQVSFDRNKVAEYEHTTLKAATEPAKDATLAYANGTFAISPDVAGKGEGISAAIANLEKGITQEGVITLPITNQPVQAKVQAVELKQVQATANNYLKTNIKISLLGKDYQPSKDDIKNWLTINLDPSKKPYTVTVDTAKVDSYVDGLSKAAYIAPVTQKITKNQDQGGAEQVLTKGRVGRQLKDKQAISKGIQEALSKQASYVASATTEEVPFKTETINIFDRFIDVDLSDFKLTAFEKGAVIRTFTVSTGAPGHKTPTGTFAIYRKTRVQTMSGGVPGTPSYYSLPNVEWINWFSGEYAVHGAYWNKVIGVRNVSHGCVNMHNVDAEFIYNWAPVGTKVVIHD